MNFVFLICWVLKSFIPHQFKNKLKMSFSCLPSDISDDVNMFYSSVDTLEKNIHTLCNISESDLLSLSSLERARAYSLLCYSVNSLYYSIIFAFYIKFYSIFTH